MPEPCCVGACRNRAEWRIRFAHSRHWYHYCDWHATRRKDVLMWRSDAVIEAERI